MAAWLSHLIRIGRVSSTSNSCNKWDNQTISIAIRGRDLYSASAEDKDTVCCFLDF